MTDDDGEAKAEELLKGQQNKSRHETPAAVESDDADDGPDLTEKIADAYGEIEDGDRPENITLRDKHLAALFAGLDATDEMLELGEQAADELERDETPKTRADVCRLLLRYAIDDLESDVLERGADGFKRHKQQEIEDVDSI